MSSDVLDKAISSLGIAILIVNEEMEIERANRAARRLFSRRVRGHTLHKATDSSKLEKAAGRALLEGKGQRLEIRIGQGRKQFLRANVVPLSSDSGKKSRRVLISFEDVTQMHRVTKMRSDFVANVSHELRSPLTSLYGFIETLRNNPEIAEEDRDRFLDLMENEAQRMVRLIDELLTLSILQAETELDLNGTVDMSALVGQVIESLAPLAHREQTNVVLQHPEHPVLVRGKHDKLTQVFHNLIENAILYGRRESDVWVSMKPDPVAADMINILVRDSGEGIAPKHLSRLTERFYRVDKGRSRSKGGTGLGLSIVKHILIQHGGELRVESTLGVGSTFAVVLPLAGASKEI